MLKKILLPIAILFVFPSFLSGQGMWLPMDLINQEFNMISKGMKMSASDIYSANSGSLKDAIVHFGGFCTGEIISSKGLVLTNHHCGYGAIQKHSSVENDYLKHGFWAASMEDEKPNEGLYVDFIISIEDVSDKILPLVLNGLSEKQAIDSVLKSNPISGKSIGVTIKSIYYGNQFIQIVSQRFSDVRLVGAPPSAVGKFGADTDNWVWPRHTGDFSMFRVYTAPDGSPSDYSPQNIPLVSNNPLTISLAGVGQGDFSMIYGFPGRTTSYLPVSEVAQQIEIMLPIKVQLREIILNTWDSAMRVNPKVKIQYASKYASVSNGWKKWIGQMEGMSVSHGIDTLRHRQGKVIKYHSANHENAFRAVDLVEEFDKQVLSLENGRKSILYFQEVLRNWELLTWSRLANDLVRLSDRGGNIDKAIKALQSFEKNYDSELDRRASKNLVNEWISAGKLDTLLNVPIQYLEETDAFVQGLFSPHLYNSLPLNSSKYSDTIRVELCRNHLAFNLWTDLITKYRSVFLKNKDKENLFESGMKEWMNLHMSAAKGSGITLAADANSTMRVSFGEVGGFSPKDGATYNHRTTTDGILDKYIPGDYEFDLPKEFRSKLESQDFGKYADLDGKLPVCILSANHTSGGNSGSPALNSDGHLIGLNFDRVWEGTMSDFYFTPERCRNIMVDVRYIMWVVDKYAGASHLIEEMKFAN